MAARAFHKPVGIQIGRIDRDGIVVSTRDAAKVLLRDWPVQECKRRLMAMEACLGVVNGGKPPSVAMDAFVQTAKEAGIYLGDYDIS